MAVAVEMNFRGATLDQYDQVIEKMAWGAQIHPSCCLGVFVDESAESVASVELIWRVRADEV